MGSGAALLASHPPVELWWLTFLHPALFVAALWADRAGPDGGRPWLRHAALGGTAGLVAFGPMLSWLIVAPAGVLGWSLLVLVQAAWYAVLGIALGWLLDRIWLPVGAAVVWTGIEAWRGIIPLNGFEWGSIAYAHVEGSWMLPVARILGGRAITFLVVLVSVAAALAVRQVWRVGRRDGIDAMEGTLRRARQPLGWLVGGLLASILITIEPPPEDGSLDILAVQGHDLRLWEETVDDRPLHVTTNMRDETLRALEGAPQPDLTIWPESSIDVDPTTPRGQRLAPLVEDAIDAAGELLAGATMDAEDPRERYITALRFDGSFEEQERYVKRRLVPFGEYIPARALLEWFPPLDQVPRDALPGEQPQQLTTSQGVRLGVIICFETLFTDVTRQNVMAGDEPAQILLSLTNDASFGETAAPAQHLAQVRLRAIETGRWAVHAALSGSSAFVDPHGNVYDPTPLFEVASIRRDVPLVADVTPYLVIGDVLGWLTRLGVVALAVLVAVGHRQRRTSVAAPRFEDAMATR